MAVLIVNIKKLIQIRDKKTLFISANEMNKLPEIDDAFLFIQNGVITDFGKMSEMPNFGDIETINAKDKIVLPAWCDSHSHSVFTGNRSDEYMQRIKGATYEEIAKNGGGILKSSNQINSISSDDFQEINILDGLKLLQWSLGNKINESILTGITTIEHP